MLGIEDPHMFFVEPMFDELLAEIEKARSREVATSWREVVPVNRSRRESIMQMHLLLKWPCPQLNTSSNRTI